MKMNGEAVPDDTSGSQAPLLTRQKRLASDGEGTAGPHPQHIRRAISYLRQQISDKITMVDLTAASGVSERTLRRNFIRFVGLPPLAYLQRLRLTSVREALLWADEPVSRVAARHG